MLTSWLSWLKSQLSSRTRTHVKRGGLGLALGRLGRVEGEGLELGLGSWSRCGVSGLTCWWGRIPHFDTKVLITQSPSRNTHQTWCFRVEVCRSLAKMSSQFPTLSKPQHPEPTGGRVYGALASNDAWTQQLTRKSRSPQLQNSVNAFTAVKQPRANFKLSWAGRASPDFVDLGWNAILRAAPLPPQSGQVVA